MNQEKRKDPRIHTHNLLSYTVLGTSENEEAQGMGRTIDVSEGGLRLETHVYLDPGQPISLSIAMEDDVMDIRGRSVYCRERADGRYECGIDFGQMEEDRRAFLRQYIALFKGEESEVGTS